MTPFVAAVLVLSTGLALILSGRQVRRRRRLGQGRTLDLDTRTIYSARYGLAGRPDRIIEGGIPEEWKSSLRVNKSHIAQLAVYFILIEEETGIRPPHGFIVTGDGRREQVENTPDLRAWVLRIAHRIRAARRQLDVPIHVNQPAAKCQVCAMLGGGCGQWSR